MIPFEEVYKFTDTIPGAFTELNCRKLYECALQAPKLIVEIGVDRGRSSSLLLAAAAQTGAEVVLIDSWVSVLRDNYYRVVEMTKHFPTVKCVVLFESSEGVIQILDHESFKDLKQDIDLIHIDGNHDFHGISFDCKNWVPRVKSGGFACFHDYTPPEAKQFFAVKQCVDIACEQWENLGEWDSLAIRRKP